MKNYLCIGLFFLAQQLSSQVVIGAAGQYDQNDAEIQWTVGEPFVHQYQSTSTTIELGFNIAWPSTMTSVLDPLETLSLEVFPNPCSSELQFSELNGVEHYRIIDLYGNVIQHSPVQMTNTIVTENLKSGAYILQVELEDERIYQGRFIKL